jgi:hypothetical protein
MIMENLAMVGAIIIGAINAYIYFYDKREQKKGLEEERKRMKQIFEESEKANEIVLEAKPETKDLAYRVLRGIGCSPEETEEGRIKFDYQDATFLMEAVDECLFVNIILPWCYSCSIFDIDEFSRVRQVVNDLNWTGPCHVFYTLNKESDEVGVHIKKSILLIPQIPLLEDYLKRMLKDFFITHRNLETELEKVRLQECEK